MNRIKQAIEQLNLEQWLEKYVEVRGVGDQLQIETCPKCFKSKWKLYIHSENKIWFCQHCQWGKGLADVTLLMSAISDRNLHDVRVELARTVVPATATDEFIKKLNEEFSKKEEEKPPILEAITVPGNPISEDAINYLKTRGLTNYEIKEYNLKSATKLRNQFGPWAVFPIYYYEVPVCYQGRKFLSKAEPKYISGEKVHNWMWPLDSKHIEEIENKKSVVIVEGVFDALGYWRIGIPALCTFGKDLKSSQVKILQTHGVEELYLSYDADAYKYIQSAAERYGHLFNIKIIELAPTKDNPKADPGDVLAGDLSEAWLFNAYQNSFSTRGSEYWNWKLRKEIGI